MADKVKWLSYEFGVYDPDTNWKNVGGIYIFAGKDSENYWIPYYIFSREVEKGRTAWGHPRPCAGGFAGGQAGGN